TKRSSRSAPRYANKRSSWRSATRSTCSASRWSRRYSRRCCSKSRKPPDIVHELRGRRHPMKTRLNPYQAAPDAMNAMLALEKYVQGSGLEPTLVELVKTRASQINGCAFCLHMHTRDARAHGETEERLYLLDAWRESSLYTPR